jgi:hypothetical protein
VACVSGTPANDSKIWSGAQSGRTSSAVGTMNVCSSANWPNSTACGTMSVKTSHVEFGGKVE